MGISILNAIDDINKLFKSNQNPMEFKSNEFSEEIYSYFCLKRHGILALSHLDEDI